MDRACRLLLRNSCLRRARNSLHALASRGDFDHLASAEPWNCSGDSRDEWPQIFDAVTNAQDDNGSDTDLPKILLMLEIAVRGHDDRESGRYGGPKQYTVVEAQPTLCPNGRCVLERQFVG
jgi:hypothetical protein